MAQDASQCCAFETKEVVWAQFCNNFLLKIIICLSLGQVFRICLQDSGKRGSPFNPLRIHAVNSLQCVNDGASPGATSAEST